MKMCKVEGCNCKHKAKGYCDKHYKQFQRGTIGDIGDTGQEIVIVQETKEETGDTIQNKGQEVVLYNKGDKETEVTKPKPPTPPRPVKKPAKKLSDEELYKKLVIESFDYLSEDESLSLEEHYYKYHNTSWLFANGIDKDEFITWQMKTCDGILRDKVPFPKPKCNTNIRIVKESN